MVLKSSEEAQKMAEYVLHVFVNFKNAYCELHSWPKIQHLFLFSFRKRKKITIKY